MTDEGFFEPVDGKLWSSSFNPQKRPDETRTAAVIPKDRLITKKGRYFTTDSSSSQLKKSFTKNVAAADNEALKTKKTFVSKNE